MCGYCGYTKTTSRRGYVKALIFFFLVYICFGGSVMYETLKSSARPIQIYRVKKIKNKSLKRFEKYILYILFIKMTPSGLRGFSRSSGSSRCSNDFVGISNNQAAHKLFFHPRVLIGPKCSVAVLATTATTPDCKWQRLTDVSFFCSYCSWSMLEGMHCHTLIPKLWSYRRASTL